MKLGISTASLFNKYFTENCFDALRSINVNTTEVFISSFCEMEKGFADALALRKGDMDVHSIHAPSIQFEGQLFSASSRVRDDAELFFSRACYVGNVLGAKYYTFHGPTRLTAASISEDVMRFADRINQLTEIAKSYGMYIAYENVHYCIFNQPEYFKTILTACPDLRTTFDIKHSLLSGIDPVRFLDVMGDKLVTVHVVDMTKDNLVVMPGQGKINFEKFFKEIDKRKLTPTVLIEAYSRNFKDMEELKTGYEYLKQIINNL